MDYPGGFSDAVHYALEEVSSLTQGNLLRRLRLAQEAGLPVSLEQEAGVCGGAALPFLLLLGEEEGDFVRAYYRLLQDVLSSAEARSSLIGLLERLGSPDSRGGERRRGEAEGGRPALLPRSPPSPSQGERRSAKERLEEMEGRLAGCEVAIRGLGEVLSRLQGELREVARRVDQMVNLGEEVAVWSEHIRFVNDRLHALEKEARGKEEASAKALEELREALEDLSLRLESLRRLVVPK